MLFDLQPMNRSICFTIPALMTCCAISGNLQEKTAHDDLKLFQGHWKLVSLEAGGRPLPADFVKEIRMSFDRNHITSTFGDSIEKTPFTIYPDTTPKGIDLRTAHPRETALGIYSFEEDTLRICYSLKERPKTFETNKRSDLFLIVLKRDRSKSTAARQQDIVTLAKFRGLGGTAFFARSGATRQLYVEIKGKDVDKRLKRLAPLLKEFSVITALHMYESDLTDSGLVHLRGINNIESINLEKAKVSDAGLAELKHMTKLRYLILTGTNVTDSGIKTLRQSLPKLKIEKLTPAQEKATMRSSRPVVR